MKKHKKESINCYLWTIVIFIQYIFLPFKVYISTSILEYIIVVCAVLLSLFINGLNMKFIRTVIVLTMVFIVDFLIFRDTKVFTFFYLSMFSSSLLMFFFTLNLSNLELFMKIYRQVSLFTLVFVSIYLFIYSKSNLSVGSYMGIGNVLSFISIPICYYLVSNNRRKLFYRIILLYLLIISLVYGNRMSVLSIYMIYQVSSLIFISNNEEMLKKYMYFGVQFILVIVVLFQLNTITNYINVILNKLNFLSYSLVKFQRILNNSDGLIEGFLSSSSGRNKLYPEAISQFQKNYYMPGGISGFKYEEAGSIIHYPHNFLLELLVNFGFLSIPLILLFFYVFLRSFKNSDITMKFLLGTFFIFSFTRLLVSSSIWLSTSLWTVLGLIYISKKYRKENNVK